MEYIRKKFTLGRDNKLELRLDTPLELPGNNWYCSLREFSLEQKWSLANEEITIYYQNGHHSIVKPGFYHSVADLDNILDELFLPMRRVKRQGRKALDRMSGIRRNNQTEEEEGEAEEEEDETETATETNIEATDTKESGTKTADPAANVETKTVPEAKPEAKEPEAKKSKTDQEIFESDFKKEGQVKLHWIPQTGHLPDTPDKIYPKPVSIEKISEHAEVVSPALPVAESLVAGQNLPPVASLDALKEAAAELEKKKAAAKNKAKEKSVETKTEEKSAETKSEKNKELAKALDELKSIHIPSKNPVPIAPTLPDFTPKKPRPVEEAKKEEPKQEIEAEPEKTEDKKPYLLEGEQINPNPATVKTEPQEEKTFFPTVKQEIIKEEEKISPEVLEFNQKGYNSVRISKNAHNYYTVTFDPNYVREIKLSNGFAKALGFPIGQTITTGDIAYYYPTSETDISHICMSINHILRPLNNEETAEVGIIPLHDQAKTIYEYFANPIWFRLETTRINLLSVEFKDFFGNPIACDNAHGHFTLVFTMHKR